MVRIRSRRRNANKMLYIDTTRSEDSDETEAVIQDSTCNNKIRSKSRSSLAAVRGMYMRNGRCLAAARGMYDYDCNNKKKKNNNNRDERYDELDARADATIERNHSSTSSSTSTLMRGVYENDIVDGHDDDIIGNCSIEVECETIEPPTTYYAVEYDPKNEGECSIECEIVFPTSTSDVVDTNYLLYKDYSTGIRLLERIKEPPSSFGGGTKVLKKAMVVTGGGTLILGGVALLVVPLPLSLPMICVGLKVLSTEFEGMKNAEAQLLETIQQMSISRGRQESVSQSSRHRNNSTSTTTSSSMNSTQQQEKHHRRSYSTI